MKYKIQTNPYTLIPGGPGPGTTENVEDPNFGLEEGHLDEINPSLSKNFEGMSYNTRNRGDVTIPAYKESDRFPETPTKCNSGDESDAEIISLDPGEYKFTKDQKPLVVECLQNPH